MALDLWHASYNQVAIDGEVFGHLDRQCDFYFGFGVDVLEENALNEKFCGEVLKILITKADTEIDELEKDLVTIQSELAWTEYEEWSELCCSTLRENIDYLENSLKSLKSEGNYHIDIDVLVHRKPADNVHEIVKALLQNLSSKKDKQPPDLIIKDSSSETPSQTPSLNAIVKEEVEELIIENSFLSYSLLKPQEEKRNFPGAVKFSDQKPTKASIKCDAQEYPLPLAAGYSDKQKISHTNNSKLTTNNKARRHKSTQNVHGMIQSSDFNPPQHAKSIKDSGVGAPDAHAISTSHEMKTSCIPKVEVDGDNEVTTQCSATKKKDNLSSPLCCSKGNRCIPKAETPTQAGVKCNDVHASRYVDDDGGKEQGSESRSGAFKVTANGNSNLEQKPIDIAISLRASPKHGVEVYTTKVDLISSLKAKENRQDTQKVPERVITKYKHPGLISTLELQYQRKKDLLKPKSEEGTLLPSLLALDKADIAAKGINSNLNMPLKPQSQKTKRKIQSTMAIMLESSGSGYPNGVGLDLPLSNVKKRQKSEVNYDNVCLNKLFHRKILKKPFLPRQNGVTADVSITVKSEKETEKGSSVGPILLDLKSPARDMNIPDSFGEGGKKTNNEEVSRSIDGCKAKDDIFFDLDHMKLVELKAIAKHYKLTNYWKLKKIQLVEQLSDLLIRKL